MSPAFCRAISRQLQRRIKMTNPTKKLSDAVALTPLQQVDNILLKRDDWFEVPGVGVRGGKVRACWAVAQGAPGLVTAGQRASSQVKIVISVAQYAVQTYGVR
jgi:hypothetical protein